MNLKYYFQKFRQIVKNNSFLIFKYKFVQFMLTKFLNFSLKDLFTSGKFSLENLLLSYTKKQYYEQKKVNFPKQIKFSILVPLYNTSEQFLREMIQSVLFQSYSNWELCLADGSDEKHLYVEKICREYSEKDKRIKYQKLKVNGGISLNTNECIKMATGDYISLFDHDDLLHPCALFEVMKEICTNNSDFIYTDELTFQSPNLHDVVSIHRKPDFAPLNLLANNYICHFTSFKRSLLDQTKWFGSKYDGSQDHELFLRLTDIAKKIAHIDKILYFWRSHPLSTAMTADSKNYATEAGINAVNDFLASKKIKAEVSCFPNCTTTYDVRYEIKNKPFVSVIITQYRNVHNLIECLKNIVNITNYCNYEILIFCENQNKFDGINSIVNHVKYQVVKTKSIDEIVKFAKGDYLVFVNSNGIVLKDAWIENLLQYAQKEEIGSVCGMTVNAKKRILNSLFFIKGNKFVEVFRNAPYGADGYMGRLLYAQNTSIVNPDLVMISKNKYLNFEIDNNIILTLNNFNSTFFARFYGAKWYNVFVPYDLIVLKNKNKVYNNLVDNISIKKNTNFIYVGKYLIPNKFDNR